MDQNLCAGELPAATGIPRDQILRSQSGQSRDVIWEHRILLWRYRDAQSEAVKEQHRRLACLDDLIAQVEGAYKA